MKKKLLITLGCSLTEGVGCYDPETLPSDMIDVVTHKKGSEVYSMNRERFHKYSWPSILQKHLNYDLLINLGFGGSSTSGNLKVWFEKYYNKTFINEYDVLVIWLLPEPSRFSFYRDSSIKNIIPYTRKYFFNTDSYDLGQEYVKFIKNIEYDTVLEQIFYLKIFEEHCKFKKYNFLYTTLSSKRFRFFENMYDTTNFMNFENGILPDYSDNLHMKSIVCDHPNEKGYEYIAKKIFDWLKLYRPELVENNTPKKFESIWDGNPLTNHFNQNKTFI